MTDSLDILRRQIDQCTNGERDILFDYLKTKLPRHPLEEEWGVNAEIILSAISRSSDLTKRGVRGIIAEAVFERQTLANLKGWEAVRFNDDRPYDFLIRSGGDNPKEVRIQVKLQRMKTQRPMLASEANRHYPKEMYVVEVQKTRGGIDLQTNEDTRPYRFGEFDILAVNMHPSTKNWHNFLFTLSQWLLPRNPDANLIEIFQPVPPSPNNVWTDSLKTCLEWQGLGEQKLILAIDPELLRRRSKRKPENE
jgi:hypothetical protein